MRASLFFFLCIGFISALIFVSIFSVYAWGIGCMCIFGGVIALFVSSKQKQHMMAYGIGFLSGIFRVVFLPDILPVSVPWFLYMSEWVRSFAMTFATVFGRLYPEPVAAFAQGILTGNTNIRITPVFMQALRSTSTLHLIAVSGYNITLVATYAYAFFHWCTVPRKLIWIVVLVCIAVFTVFVGAPASAVRASIMASLVVIAQRFYRSGYGKNVLAFACMAMLVVQPSLVFDLGFQLSFLATAGILEVAPMVRIMWRRRCGTESESNVFIETIAAQSMVMPVLVYNFGTISLIGLVANFVVVPLIPFAMAISAFSGIGFYFFEPLGRALAFVSLPFFLFITKTISWFGSLPLASVSGVRIPAAFIVAYYLGIGIWILQKEKTMRHIHE